jgi:hypothetical protein
VRLRGTNPSYPTGEDFPRDKADSFERIGQIRLFYKYQYTLANNLSVRCIYANKNIGNAKNLHIKNFYAILIALT